MKTLSAILGYLSLFLLGVMGVLYWTAIWGGIGFFGSILTSPFSEMIAIFLLMIGSLSNFIFYLIWFAVTAVLLSYATSE